MISVVARHEIPPASTVWVVDIRRKRRHEFGDVAVAGGTLRMPVGGVFAMRPSRKNPAKCSEGKVTFAYSDFQEVPRR